MDDVIGMFGEDVCNASGNRLVEEAELGIYSQIAAIKI